LRLTPEPPARLNFVITGYDPRLGSPAVANGHGEALEISHAFCEQNPAINFRLRQFPATRRVQRFMIKRISSNFVIAHHQLSGRQSRAKEGRSDYRTEYG